MRTLPPMKSIVDESAVDTTIKVNMMKLIETGSWLRSSHHIHQRGRQQATLC